MKKILITGGSGTVGSAFIRKYYNEFEFHNFSRNETQAFDLINEFPKVKNHIGDIRDFSRLLNVFEKVKPDIVIHTAALKHVNIAEENATEAISVNIVGSRNIINSSILTSVPITIAISTDKACSPDNVYGYTKQLMERMFLDAHSEKTKFVCARFANVVGASGSVVPFWKALKAEGKPLKLTSDKMNRLMLSQTESAELIHAAIDFTDISIKSFILSKMTKSVNMLDMAKVISDDYEIVGLRPGEKLNETLISEKESKQAYLSPNGKYIILYNDLFNTHDNPFTKELSSLTADRMTPEEIKKLIK